VLDAQIDDELPLMRGSMGQNSVPIPPEAHENKCNATKMAMSGTSGKNDVWVVRRLVSGRPASAKKINNSIAHDRLPGSIVLLIIPQVCVEQ